MNDQNHNDEFYIDSLNAYQAMAVINKISYICNCIAEDKKEMAFFALGTLTERLAKNVRTFRENELKEQENSKEKTENSLQMENCDSK